MRTPRHLAAGACAALVLTNAAAAQERDPTGNYDTRDVLGRLPHEIDDLPTVEEAQGRAVTFGLSLDGTYTSNAGVSHNDAVEAGYLTPEVNIGVTPVSFGGWLVGAGAALDGDYYLDDDHDDDFGEGRLEGFVFAEHELGAGTVTAEGVALGVFSNDFSNHAFNLYVGDLTYSVRRGNLSGEVGADIEVSDIPELRRARLKAALAYTFPQTLLGHEFTIEGDAAFSEFTGGANSSRNDVVAALVLLAERQFSAGWSLGWEAAYVNRFSNRESARFEALDLAVALGKQF